MEQGECGGVEASGGGMEVDLENSDQEATASLEVKKQKNCLVRIVTGHILFICAQ